MFVFVIYVAHASGLTPRIRVDHFLFWCLAEIKQIWPCLRHFIDKKMALEPSAKVQILQVYLHKIYC